MKAAATGLLLDTELWVRDLRRDDALQAVMDPGHGYSVAVDRMCPAD